MQRNRGKIEPEAARPGKQLEALLEGLEQEEPPKAGHMKSTVSGRAAGVVYVVGALDLCAFLLGMTVLGGAFGLETWCEIGAQIFVGVLSLLLIKYLDVSYQIGLDFKGFRVGLLALFPLALAGLAWMRPLNQTIGPDVAVIAGLGALTAAVWEEACFRGFGVFLFAKEDGSIGRFAAIGSSVFFGATKLIELALDPADWADILLRCLFSIALGAFLLALYLYTKNLLLPILIHFLFNLAETVFTIYSDAPPTLGQEGSLLLFATAGIVLLVWAVWLFLRHERRIAAAAADAKAEPSEDTPDAPPAFP